MDIKQEKHAIGQKKSRQPFVLVAFMRYVCNG